MKKNKSEMLAIYKSAMDWNLNEYILNPDIYKYEISDECVSFKYEDCTFAIYSIREMYWMLRDFNKDYILDMKTDEILLFEEFCDQVNNAFSALTNS